jgi:beta-lactamase class A
MPLNRRTFAAAAPALLASPALAMAAPIAALGDYERASGGRIGIFARNLKTGASLA